MALRFAWIISERDSVVRFGVNERATAPSRRPGPRRMQVAGAQKKKEVWPHNEEANLDQVQQKVCLFLVNWQQPVVFLVPQSSLPDRYLPSTSKSSAQTVIKLSGIGLYLGPWGRPSWSYTSASCLKVSSG